MRISRLKLKFKKSHTRDKNNLKVHFLSIEVEKEFKNLYKSFKTCIRVQEV